jgi:hypothetical protein
VIIVNFDENGFDINFKFAVIRLINLEFEILSLNEFENLTGSY